MIFGTEALPMAEDAIITVVVVNAVAPKQGIPGWIEYEHHGSYCHVSGDFSDGIPVPYGARLIRMGSTDAVPKQKVRFSTPLA